MTTPDDLRPEELPEGPPLPAGLPSEVNVTFNLQRTLLRGPEGMDQTQVLQPLPSPFDADSAWEEAPRLELRELLAQGGMGEVWRATQRSLRRVVAVKKLRAQGPAPAGTDVRPSHWRSCLIQEALFLANLDHPNIVPIHDLVRSPDGDPLLAMKLVKGDPWDGLLVRDRAALSQEDLLARHMPILLAVAQAVAFAHAKGILHRDLKPSQVMVGAFGEVILMDWGLAVIFDEALAAREGVDPALGLATRATASSPSGTLAYMAPEQTLQDASRLGPWTDLFLLGGTLYHILTGIPPLGHGQDSVQTFLAASKGRITPVETRCPQAPPELVELCRQALRVEPEDRNLSVAGFIEGLQAFLSGTSRRREAADLLRQAGALLPGAATYEDLNRTLTLLGKAQALWPEAPGALDLHDGAVTAYARLAQAGGDLKLAQYQAEQLQPGEARETLRNAIAQDLATRARHRRQRRWALVGTGLLGLAMLGSGYVYTVRVHRAGLRAELARNQAEDLIRYMLEDLHGQLKPLGRTNILKPAGDKALRYFDGLPKDEVSPGSLLQRAHALEQVAHLQGDFGELGAAIGTQRAAAAILEGLRQQPGDRRLVRKELVGAYQQLADLMHKDGRTGENLVCIQKQARLLDEAMADQSGSEDLLKMAAEAAFSSARLHEELGDMENARASMGKALGFKLELRRLRPEDNDVLEELSGIHDEYGRLLYELGQPAPAQAQQEQAIACAQLLVARQPGNLNWQRGVSICKSDLSILLVWLGRTREARGPVEESLAIARALHQGDPQNAVWTNDYSMAIRTLGEVHLASEDFRGALVHFRSAEELARGLVARSPRDGNWRVRARLAGGKLFLAEALLALGRPGEAQPQILAARQLVEEAATGQETMRQGYLGWASLLEGEALLALPARGAGSRERFLQAEDALMKADRLQMRTRIKLMRVLIRLDRRAEAQALATKLWQAGFREPRTLALMKRAFPGQFQG